MLKEHDIIVLTEDMPKEGLRAGDSGVIVHIYLSGETYEVEFMALNGDTITVETIPASHVRPVTSNDMSHARTVSA